MQEQVTSGSDAASTNGTHNHQHPPHRPARSKNGCMTCRRRKVRCDEQRPRCSHCERLNLQCKWRPAYDSTGSTSTQWRFIGVGASTGANGSGEGDGSAGSGTTLQVATPDESSVSQGQMMPATHTVSEDAPVSGCIDSPPPHLWLQNPGAVDQLFDYASFMWDSTGDVLGQLSPQRAQASFGPGYETNDPWATAEQFTTTSNTSQPLQEQVRGRDPNALTTNGNSRMPSAQVPLAGQLSDDHDMIKYFVHAIVPPILAEVETQKRWASMRQILISMSNGSTMVRCAILAFTNLLYHRRQVPWIACPKQHYDSALDELLTLLEREGSNGAYAPSPREHVLATLFFLSYFDILEDRMGNAHDHLKRAYGIFQGGNKRGFRPVEIRLLSWIRLLDARAVSAGGEGLFLSDSSESLVIQPSPASADEPVDPEHVGGASGGGSVEIKEWDIEDVLFQVLYHPGVVFFQKVQSFMGRISKIDPWHRSRGTIEDEMEVMQIAHQILKDLRELYDNRPTLMDHAVEGRLTPPHVSTTLATAITRAFRTYLSNYHASKVHLHRVAYKHLELSRETNEAIRQIRRLTRQLVEALGPGDALPVSQLWPLLMLGSEERDPVERAWIKEQILQMEKVATNARITAHVLEEVQARQDASNGRVDIRSVMHAIFDSCFAIM